MMLAVVTGVTVAACSKPQEEEVLPADEEEYTYTVTIGETKASLDGDHMAWDSGDEVGWFFSSPNRKGSSEVSLTDPRSFTVTTGAKNPLSAGAYIYVYAPYKSGDQSSSSAPLSIPVEQDGDDISDAMPMVSLPIRVSETVPVSSTSNPIGEASFLNLGALIHFNIYTSNASYNTEKVESVRFTSGSNIAGDFTVNLTTVALNAIPSPSGLSEKSVLSTLASATTVGGSKGAGVPVYMVIAPGTFSGTILVRTNVAKYSYTLTSTAFSRAQFKHINVDLGSANASRSVIEDRYFYHDFASGDWGVGSDPENHPDGDYYTDWGLISPYTIDGVSWSWTLVNNSPAFDAGGMFMFNWAFQIGNLASGVGDYVLSTSGIPGTINEVSLGGYADNSVDISCKVGGNSFGTGSISTPAGKEWDVDYTGKASGEITITFHATDVIPVWLYYVYVGYTD